MDHPNDILQQQQRHPQRHHQPGRWRGRGRGAREHEAGDGVCADLGSQTSANPAFTHVERPPRRHHRRPPRPEQPTDEPAPSTSTSAAPVSHPPRPSRRDKFRATLTEVSEGQTTPAATSAPQHEPALPPVLAPAPAENPEPEPEPKPKSKPKPTSTPKPRRARDQPHGDDLTSTLIHALRTPPFPDCPICFNPIRSEHPTWSCSPPTAAEARFEDKGAADGSHCCWSTFHLKCIRAWAEKSVKELQEAWRARGELRPGEWRCPGCRATRQAVPQTYMCFCLRVRHPAPPRIATPHSCAQPCSRPRSTCGHACPLPCHPGPCPPCAVTIQVACFCGKEWRSAKCQLGVTAVLSFSCTQSCRKPLRCGNSEHRCAEACHEGPCPPCPDREEVRCWCGQETKHVACGEVKVEESTKCIVVKDDGSEQVWMGSYGCGHPCERPFACSHHSCSKPCHPPSRTPPPCPFDPERVVSCACGRRRIARSSDELAASDTRSSAPPLPSRTSCTSPLPTCTSPCSKPLPCGHLCQTTCHWDPCPPCTEQVERTCRCGATKHKIPCGDAILALDRSYLSTDGDIPASEDILCDKPCHAVRSCGRHQCGRICCPLASLQRTAAKSSKRRDPLLTDLDAQLQIQIQLDPATRALHECDLPCGRVLGCGNHRCLQRDHKGSCAMCPRGVFEELVCLCGRTVLEPPIRCGTRLQCMYPCARPAPACGHPHVAHACHEGVVVAGVDTADEGLRLVEEMERDGAGGGSCPPCPFLTEKVCACGKKRVGNVRCSQERVSCGSVCGKLLACGFHHCERPCHADDCGTCTAVCGKFRKSCLPANHPCTQICHAPAACSETEPCFAPVTHMCPCGHLRSTVPCSGTRLALACTGECEIKKRNARLAEALGINEEKREAKARVTWSGELVGIARGLGAKFVGVVEKAFADFITSERRTQVLPHMPPERRKFVHDLALVYRMDTVMVDQEPNRSVQLIRRIDTRVPMPLLSQHMTLTGATMGRLVIGKGAGVGVGTNSGGSAWGLMTSGASGSAGASAGTGRWNAVAKSTLGASRSGSVTPARVPSPAGEAVRSREVSPRSSRLSLSGSGAGDASTGAGVGTNTSASGGTSLRGGVWVSPSVRVQRERESAMAAQAETAPTLGAVEVGAMGEGVDEVPSDWEDDV